MSKKNNDQNVNKKSEESHYDSLVRRDYGGCDRSINRENITEKMQRPKPWPDPPSEDSTEEKR